MTSKSETLDATLSVCAATEAILY